MTGHETVLVIVIGIGFVWLVGVNAYLRAALIDRERLEKALEHERTDRVVACRTAVGLDRQNKLLMTQLEQLGAGTPFRTQSPALGSAEHLYTNADLITAGLCHDCIDKLHDGALKQLKKELNAAVAYDDYPTDGCEWCPPDKQEPKS
jgi:hypothetical protein